MSDWLNDHIEYLNDRINEHPYSFSGKMNIDVINIHRDAFPIDTHMDSISSAYNLGADFRAEEFKPNYRSFSVLFYLLIMRAYPKGKNRPHFGQVNQTDMVKGLFGGGCFSAHAIIQNFVTLPWSDPWKNVQAEHEYLKKHIVDDKSEFEMRLCKTSDEAIAAKNNKERIAIFSAEGSHNLGSNAHFGYNRKKSWRRRLRRLQELKRNYHAAYLTLDHFCSTDVSKPARSINIFSKWFWRTGLGEFGKRVVGKAFDEGLLVDLSHSSTESILEVCELANNRKVPVFASHSGSRSVATGHKMTKSIRARRMMEDSAIKAIVETNGCISVIISPQFLQYYRYNNGSAVNDGNLGLFVGHYEQMANLIFSLVPENDPWDHLSFGTDFDGGIASIPWELRSGRDLPLLTLTMLERGWPADRINKVYSGNFLRVWSEAEGRAKKRQPVQRLEEN